MDIFTAIFALVIGFASLWFSTKFFKLYLKVKKWDRVKAKVVSKEISLHKKYSSARSPYKLSATYKYNYNGIEYTGQYIYMVELMGGQANHMKGDAERRSDKIKEEMEVFVNPKDPARSVMYCDGAGLNAFVLFMGIFSVLFGISRFF